MIDSRILTSLDLFDLIVELETALDIRISEDLILAKNFATVEKIVQTVLNEVDC